jgi:hypothetical protein
MVVGFTITFVISAYHHRNSRELAIIMSMTKYELHAEQRK